MAPSITQESSTVGTKLEASIAAEAAEKLASSLPDKPIPQIVEDLLTRLRQKRELREKRGLNHWESFCPNYLEKLVTRFRVGDPLRQIVRFIVVNHSSAVEFATRITCDGDMAETAASRTYIELLKGRTTVGLFYRALKMNARNLLRGRARELKRLESLDGLLAAPAARQKLSSDEQSFDYSEAIDFSSMRLEDRDPADVLIARAELQDYSDEIGRAIREVRRTRDNRRILDADWWQESALCAWERADWKRRQGGKNEGSGE